MTTRLDDGELLAAWSAGDRGAANSLIERHFAIVYRFFATKVDRELDDLVQQTFLACLEARDRFERRSSFVGFLLGIARNLLFNHYRRKQRSPVAFATSSIRDDATSPSEVVARHEDEALLNEALRRIPVESQIVLELTYWEGLAGQEVAAALGTPVATIYTKLHRARECLRTRLVELSPDRAALADALLDRSAERPTLGWPVNTKG